MLKAAAIGAIAVYGYAKLNEQFAISAKLPEAVREFAWVIPGAVAGIAAKKWG